MIISRHEGVEIYYINDEKSNKFVWSKADQCYSLSLVQKPLLQVFVSGQTLRDVIAGDYKEVFPEYDEEKHVICTDASNSYLHKEEDIALVEVKVRETIGTDNGLPYGIYKVCNGKYGMNTVLKPIEFSSDSYLDFGQDFCLLKAFTEFKNKSPREGSRKRGAILLYGPPGNGKTSSICKLAKTAQENKLRVFFLERSVDFDKITDFRDVLKDEIVVFVIEELTERTSGNNESILSFLDGETSWNNCFVVATTNYPEELPWNIIDRPGRFGSVIEVKNPNADQRRKYMQLMGIPDEALDTCVRVTEGLCFDYVKCTVLDSIDNRTTVAEEVMKYKERRSRVSKAFKAGKLGIGE